MKKEIRICGFGGQGIILAGVVLGEACSRAGLNAVQTQSYGPESRGGAARAEVVISSDPIAYPRVLTADLLIALSQPGYDRFHGETAADGLVIVDRDLVTTDGQVVSVPFNTTAEGIGRKIVANIIMLGYLGAQLDFLPDDVLEATVLDNIPKGTEELNRTALAAGRNLLTGGAS